MSRWFPFTRFPFRGVVLYSGDRTASYWFPSKACWSWRVEGSGGVTHTETAEEVRKDWEVGEFSFSLFFFSKDLSHEAKAE